jgi:hypothetical protein
MTYARTRYGLGLDLGELFERGTTAVQAAAKVLEDPALPEVTCQVLRLNALASNRPSPVCPAQRYTLAQKQKGIGLHLAVTPLRIAVWARMHPLLATAVAGGSVLGLVGLGYALGKGAR